MVHLDFRPVKQLPDISGPYLEIKWYRLFPYQHAIPKVANYLLNSMTSPHHLVRRAGKLGKRLKHASLQLK